MNKSIKKKMEEIESRCGKIDAEIFYLELCIKDASQYIKSCEKNSDRIDTNLQISFDFACSEINNASDHLCAAEEELRKTSGRL